MAKPITHTVEAPSALLTYDVREPETPSVHRPLFIFGSPMGASGFEQLVSQFADRTVITYDPRGMERSTREAGSELTAEVHAEDYHRVIEAANLGGEGGLARRGGEAFANLLGVDAVLFPGDRGGFAANKWSPNNDPAAFAAKLRELLDE